MQKKSSLFPLPPFLSQQKNKSKSQQNWSQTQLIARGAHFPFRRAFRSVFSLSFLNCFFKVDFLASVKSTPDPDRSVVFFWLGIGDVCFRVFCRVVSVVGFETKW